MREWERGGGEKRWDVSLWTLLLVNAYDMYCTANGFHSIVYMKSMSYDNTSKCQWNADILLGRHSEKIQLSCCRLMTPCHKPAESFGIHQRLQGIIVMQFGECFSGNKQSYSIQYQHCELCQLKLNYSKLNLWRSGLFKCSQAMAMKQSKVNSVKKSRMLWFNK